MQTICVWAEHLEGFVLAGSLSFGPKDGERFTYDASYLERGGSVPVYPVLPLQEEPHSAQSTRAAFSSLGPEGPVGHDIRVALRAGRDAIVPVLSRLNHETTGALTFTEERELVQVDTASPMPVDSAFLEQFAINPNRTAFKAMLDSRLSLNGAVSKVGAIRRDGAWLLPRGLEPSTHILKAGSPAYADQMLNEALCMRCALACGFEDAAKTDLIAIDGCDPILVSKRFDRLLGAERPKGLNDVMRLHQADLCQVLGISVDALKYTPSDELIDGYTTSVAAAISEESSERYGDRSYVFDIQVFDYLVGNCDNHLKNLSLTWSPDWQGKTVSPIYDVTCTTVYRDLSRDMGMGIGLHRAIDDVEPADFPLMARQLGVSWRQARESISAMADAVVPALMESAHQLEVECGVAAESVAEGLAQDCAGRVEVARRAALL
ncbi:MAG: HipA domain-containing protein [Coriobacteriales bacterium]|nr:HipA domain-containing protein [Coriobacteriales bacterium]